MDFINASQMLDIADIGLIINMEVTLASEDYAGSGNTENIFYQFTVYL